MAKQKKTTPLVFVAIQDKNKRWRDLPDHPASRRKFTGMSSSDLPPDNSKMGLIRAFQVDTPLDGLKWYTLDDFCGAQNIRIAVWNGAVRDGHKTDYYKLMQE